MIDLRSDTVTRPTPAMREAMLTAPLGDDVFGDDPTVNALQDRLARDLGFERALFFPTGTQCNLAAIMAHCQRGDEYLVGQSAHTYRYEAGGAAVLGSVQPQPVAHQPDGTLALTDLAAAIKPDDPHFARTRLIALENTFGGRALPLAWMDEVADLADAHGLGLHLDGARLFNAATALGQPARALTARFDSVSVCLSKGLGAPAGSVLLGDRELIARATRHRKQLGGAMRQSGMLAAAGLYALDHHVDRLATDHQHAEALAFALSTIPALTVERCSTNMVFVAVPAERASALAAFLQERGVLILPGPNLRLVTHLDVSAAQIEQAADAFAAFFA